KQRSGLVFTHASWAPDRTLSYERLEFLGDSVLELAVAGALYGAHPDFSEGRLAKIRSHVVSRQSCAVVARELALGRWLHASGGSPPPRSSTARRSGREAARRRRRRSRGRRSRRSSRSDSSLSPWGRGVR